MELQQNASSRSLGEEVKEVLSEHLKDHPWQSPTGLANDKVGKTTLHKIYTGSNQTPSERTVIGIILEMNKGKSWDEIVKKYKNYGKLFDVLKQYGEKHYEASSQNTFTSSDYEDSLKNEDIFRAVIMSQADNGVSKMRIEKLFGYEVLKAIELLVEKEILLEKDGYIHSTKEIINAKQDTVLTLIINILKKCYNLEAFGTGIKNELRLEYRTDVNKDYLMPRLSKKIINFTTEIRELFDDSAAKGNDVVWTITGMDSLLKNIVPVEQTKEKLQ